MSQPSEQRRWYNAPIPPWFPGWLVACVAVGSISAFAFSYGLDQWRWDTFTFWFALGFGITLVLLTAVHARRSESTDSSAVELRSGFYPPPWVRHTVLVTLTVAIGVGMISRQRITIGRAADRVTIAEGPIVAILGSVVVAAPSYFCVRMLRRQPSSRAERWTGAIGLAVVVAGGVYAVYLLIAMPFG